MTVLLELYALTFFILTIPNISKNPKHAGGHSRVPFLVFGTHLIQFLDKLRNLGAPKNRWPQANVYLACGSLFLQSVDGTAT